MRSCHINWCMCLLPKYLPVVSDLASVGRRYHGQSIIFMDMTDGYGYSSYYSGRNTHLMNNFLVRHSTSILDTEGSADVLALSNGDLFPMPSKSKGYSPDN